MAISQDGHEAHPSNRPHTHVSSPKRLYRLNVYPQEVTMVVESVQLRQNGRGGFGHIAGH